MSQQQIQKLQQGGSMRDWVNEYKFQPLKKQSSSTKVATKPQMTKQQADENKDAQDRKAYIQRQEDKDRQLKLKQKGQNDTGNLVNDMGTNMLTLTTQFRTPDNKELEAGRGSWSDRSKLLMNNASQGMLNELTGGAMNWAGKQIVNGAGPTLYKNIKKGINKAYDFVDKRIAYPVVYRKEISAIKERTKELLAENLRPESIKRMNNLNVNAELFNNTAPAIKTANDRSHYNSIKDRINIDAEQLLNLQKNYPGLSMDAVIDHEIGHRYQGFNVPRPKNEFKVVVGDGPKAPQRESALTWVDQQARYIEPKANLDKLAQGNADYFYSGGEPLAHMMETRRGMIEKGLLKDRHDNITVPLLRQYFKQQPKDRIATFINPKGHWNFRNLKELMNQLPAATGATVAGVNYLNDTNKKANP